MKSLKKALLLSSLSLTTLSAFAGSASNIDQPQRMWSEHKNTYLGTVIGFNLNKFNFYNLNAQFHTVTQKLFLGYLLTKNWGVEGEVGSYFSGLGLGFRASIKGVLPVSNRVSLSADIGVSYISTFLEKGFVGPHVGLSGNFFLSPQLAWTFTVDDIVSSYDVTPGNRINTNFLSALTGFTYYLD